MNEQRKQRKTWISSAHQGFVTEGLCSNTREAFWLAACKGADMIETDARTTQDGVLICHHDADIRAYGPDGQCITYAIADTPYETVRHLALSPVRPEKNRVPTLAEALDLAYFTGMCVNIDLKEGALHAADVARLVVAHGMRGRVVYATNGAGAPAILTILQIDPMARFIDTPWNYTREELAQVPDYPARCYAYTGDFSDENIRMIRESGCMLATISLHAGNAAAAFRHHPDMAEYPHTSDFEAIDCAILEQFARP